MNLVVEVERDDAVELAERSLAELHLKAGWVTAAEARDDEPEAYDERLARLCSESPSLLPVPALLPPAGLPGAYDRARRIAAAARWRVVRLCPTAHRYALVDWVLSPLPELCEREGLAVVLDFAPDPVPWRDVVELARVYPTLPLVVLGVELGADRSVAAVLDTAPNVICAVADLRSARHLARLCELFGASRFVCGSDGRGDRARVFDAIAGSADLADDTRGAVLEANAEALAHGRYADTFLS